MSKFGFLTYDLQPFTEDCLYRIQSSNEWARIKAYPIIEHRNQEASRVDYMPSRQKGKFFGPSRGRRTPEGFAININIKSVYKCVIESDVVVLFGLQGASAVLAVIFGKILRRPILTVSQTLPVQYEKNRRWWVRGLKNFIYRCGSLHVSQSSATTEVLTAVYNIPQSKIVFAQFEAGASLFREKISNKALYSDTKSIRVETATNFLFVGNLHPFKGVGTIIEALSMIREKGKFICHFAGPQAGKDGEVGTTRYWINIACKYSVLECVNFLGQLNFEQLIKAYSECDVVVLPTYRDMFPKVLVEGALFEKPLISTTANGANNAIIINNINGFVVDPGDPSALATAMQMLSSANLRYTMGKRSRQMVDHLCTIDNENEGFSKALKAMDKFLK
jgi:glycosyltransferase involved in cell wall biosynthesis